MNAINKLTSGVITSKVIWPSGLLRASARAMKTFLHSLYSLDESFFMYGKYMDFNFESEKIDTLIQLAIQEDIGTGDITTENLIPDGLFVEGLFIAKENGIIAGLPVVEYFFSKLDKSVFFKQSVKEGTPVKKGEAIATIHGSAKILLSGERIALNFLQRLSGIATLTAQFVERIKPLKTTIMDTRK